MSLSLAKVAVYSLTAYTVANKQWRQFIHDHRSYLWERALLINISPEKANAYKFHPIDLLTSEGVPREHIWIVLWLNNIDPLKFDGISTLKAPPQNVIRMLHDQFVMVTSSKLPSTIRTTAGI